MPQSPLALGAGPCLAPKPRRSSPARGPALGTALLVVLVVLLLVLLGALAAVLAAGVRHREACAPLLPKGSGALGGYAPSGSRTRRPGAKTPPPPAHVVVDTLNLTHWLASQAGESIAAPTLERIVGAIDQTAARLRARFPGRVMYVLKDRETQANTAETRAQYQAAATRNAVYVEVVERYADDAQPASDAASRPAEHSSRARDDFYMALLARRWRCAVLTEDRLRDFDRFRATVRPFHVYEYAFWRGLPHREYVRPDASAHARLGRPRPLRYAEVFGPS